MDRSPQGLDRGLLRARRTRRGAGGDFFFFSPRPVFSTCHRSESLSIRLSRRRNYRKHDPEASVFPIFVRRGTGILMTAADRESSAAACGGRPCWRGCLPPTSANAPPVAGVRGSSPPLTDPASIRTYLESVGLPAMPPLRARIDPDTGRQATRMDSELGRRTGKRSSGSYLTLAVRSAP